MTTKPSKHIQELQKKIIDLVWAATDGGTQLKESDFSYMDEPLSEWTALESFLTSMEDTIRRETLEKVIEIVLPGHMPEEHEKSCSYRSIMMCDCKLLLIAKERNRIYEALAKLSSSPQEKDVNDTDVAKCSPQPSKEACTCKCDICRAARKTGAECSHT